jgi:5-methyltetrahydropteroyltriglutamate--homocysteine methyltransferase
VADDYKYHIDHHGSLVRPAGLIAARPAGGSAPAEAVAEAVAAVAHVQRRLALGCGSGTGWPRARRRMCVVSPPHR